MGTTKNALKRYLIIDELVSKGGLSRKDLFRKLNQRLKSSDSESVSIETLDVDIRNMKKEFNAPIKNSKSIGYHYQEEGYRHLQNNQLSEAEVRALDFSLSILAEKNHVTLIREARTILNKIYRKASNGTQSHQVMLSDTSMTVQGVEWLAPLHEAILNKKCVVIDHYSLRQKKVVKHYFSPYALREYRGLWYVIGYTAIKGLVYNLALDRVRDVRDAIGTSYKLDESFDLKKYFKHSVGITTSREKPVKVIFWANADSYYFLKVQPVHQSQKILKEEKGGFILELTVYLGEELFINLMGLGSRIKVLEPPELVEQFREHSKKMKDYYS